MALDLLDKHCGLTGKATRSLNAQLTELYANGLYVPARGTLAATGSEAGDAAVIIQVLNAVTAANGTKGVALPAAAVTVGPILVINTVLTTGATLKVYPVSGGNDNINALAEDAAFVMGPGKSAWFIPTSATQWYVEDASSVTSTTTEANLLTGLLATTAEINQACDLSAQVMTPGAGILAGVGTVYKTSIIKQGDIIKTTIFLDLTGLASSTTDLDIIGTAGICHLGQITAAKNGALFFGQVTCLETPAGGADDVIFYSAESAAGAFDGGIAALTGTEVVLYDKTSAAAAAAATQVALAALPAANTYLYLVNGEAGTAATYTAGQFMIELWGF